MKLRRRVQKAIALVVGAAAIGLPMTAGPATSVARAASLPHIVVTSGGFCICHAPLYVGMQEGFFARHGVSVSLLDVSSGFAGMGALQTGSADVADAVPGVAAQAEAEGVAAKAVLVANGDATGKVDTSKYFAIIARKGSGIVADNLHSLEGKTIGLAVGTIGEQYFYYTMQKAGINALKQTTIENVSPTDLVSALESSSVDAIVSWEPIPLEALQNVPGAYTVYRGGGAIQYLFSRWMSTSFIGRQPKAVRDFVAGFVQSMQWAREHPVATAKILVPYFKGLSLSLIEQSLKYLDFDPRVSKLTIAAANQGVNFDRAIGAVTQRYDYASNLDQKLVLSVLKQYPQYLTGLLPIPANEQLRGWGNL